MFFLRFYVKIFNSARATTYSFRPFMTKQQSTADAAPFTGLFFDKKLLFALGCNILTSGEADAIILHGMARPGMLAESAPERLLLFLEINKEIIRGYAGMEKGFGLPVFIGSIFAPWESQMIYDLNKEGIRIYDRLDETAQILSLMYRYRVRRESMNI